MQPYLEDSFLNRVRRAYRCAIAIEHKAAGLIWSPINESRADIHSALLAEGNCGLRAIFIDPAATDLFLGVAEELCRTRGSTVGPEAFMQVALNGARTKYAASQIPSVAALLAKAGVRSVVEIGPGMGRLALSAVRCGITDYTTIDLPLGVVVQACFLARALGPDKLWFDGEPGETAPGKIKLFSAGRLPNAANYGLAVNIDSMTEMPWHTAFDYAQCLGSARDFFFR